MFGKLKVLLAFGITGKQTIISFWEIIGGWLIILFCEITASRANILRWPWTNNIFTSSNNYKCYAYWLYCYFVWQYCLHYCYHLDFANSIVFCKFTNDVNCFINSLGPLLWWIIDTDSVLLFILFLSVWFQINQHYAVCRF